MPYARLTIVAVILLMASPALAEEPATCTAEELAEAQATNTALASALTAVNVTWSRERVESLGLTDVLAVYRSPRVHVGDDPPASDARFRATSPIPPKPWKLEPVDTTEPSWPEIGASEADWPDIDVETSASSSRWNARSLGVAMLGAGFLSLGLGSLALLGADGPAIGALHVTGGILTLGATGLILGSPLRSEKHLLEAGAEGPQPSAR